MSFLERVVLQYLRNTRHGARFLGHLPGAPRLAGHKQKQQVLDRAVGAQMGRGRGGAMMEHQPAALTKAGPVHMQGTALCPTVFLLRFPLFW